MQGEERRQQIRDVDYWRIESLHWYNAWIKKDESARRWDIDNLAYWRCEAAFWTQIIASPREDIADARYWETEHDHYNLQLASLAADTTSPSQLTASSEVNTCLHTSTAPSSKPPTRASSPVKAMLPRNQTTLQRRSSRLRRQSARAQHADCGKSPEDKCSRKRRKRQIK